MRIISLFCCGVNEFTQLQSNMFLSFTTTFEFFGSQFMLCFSQVRKKTYPPVIQWVLHSCVITLPSLIIGSIVKQCPGFIIPTALFSERKQKKFNSKKGISDLVSLLCCIKLKIVR